MAAIFELEQVSYSYPEGQQALAEVSFSVAAGESVALLGANASGKSTLLQIMDALIFPAAGRVRAFGEALDQKRAETPEFAARFRRKVGLVFQQAEAQLFSPTVRDEIAFGPLQLGLAQEDALQRVEKMLALSGLTGLAERPPYSLSGGEKKKVALASVLAIEPEVLLLDEPSGDLDPRSQTWLIELLESLHAGGKTLITATHDLSIVEEIADRVIVLGEDHRLHAQGTSEEVLGNTELLLKVNLIHEHAHEHGAMRHRHPHGHGFSHRHGG